MSKYNYVEAKELSNIDNSTIIDVRTNMEHAEISLEANHIHVVLDDLDPNSLLETGNLSVDSNIYLLCRSGKRAEQAADKFLEAGYINVNVIKGGIIACKDCGHGVKSDYPEASTGNRPIPLERQVRIGAGIIILIGSILTLLVHNIFAIIPLVLGSGLIFAGVTDKCGFALILTKAPWNKIDSKTCCKEDNNK